MFAVYQDTSSYTTYTQRCEAQVIMNMDDDDERTETDDDYLNRDVDDDDDTESDDEPDDSINVELPTVEMYKRLHRDPHGWYKDRRATVQQRKKRLKTKLDKQMTPYQRYRMRKEITRKARAINRKFRGADDTIEMDDGGDSSWEDDRDEELEKIEKEYMPELELLSAPSLREARNNVMSLPTDEQKVRMFQQLRKACGSSANTVVNLLNADILLINIKTNNCMPSPVTALALLMLLESVAIKAQSGHAQNTKHFKKVANVVRDIWCRRHELGKPRYTWARVRRVPGMKAMFNDIRANFKSPEAINVAIHDIMIHHIVDIGSFMSREQCKEWYKKQGYNIHNLDKYVPFTVDE